MTINRELVVERVDLMLTIRNRLSLKTTERGNIISTKKNTKFSTLAFQMASPFVLQKPKKFTLADNITINGFPWIPIALYSSRNLNFYPNLQPKTLSKLVNGNYT